jgi:hypothetical protein
VIAQIQFRNTGAPTSVTCTAGGATWAHALPTGDSVVVIESPLALEATTMVRVICMGVPAGISVAQYAIDALQVASLH